MELYYKRKVNATAYLFIAPFFIFLAMFWLFPMINVFILSFQKDGILAPATWVGLDNYRKIFSNPEFLNDFLNNLFYVIVIVPSGSIIMGITLSVLLREKTRITSFFESVYFLPLLLSMVTAGTLMYFLFSSNGPINYVLLQLGLGEINWFGNPILAKLVICFLEVWKGDTFFIFIYVAALRAIPEEYYEACFLDGASRFQTIRYITLPLIKGTILFCVTMSTIWSFQIFDSIYVTTGGGPLKTTRSVVQEIYLSTFKHNDPGLGAALSIVFLVVILGVSLVQSKVLNTKSDSR